MGSSELPVALITGGSRGIGAATAKLLAARGHQVVISFVANEIAAARTVEEIEEAGGQALAVKSDVAQEPDVLALFAEVDARFERLDMLVNNAGIVGHPTSVAEMSLQRMTKIMQTNVIGSFLCAREAVNRMALSKGGRGGAIVNLSSASARLGSPNQYVDYAASKAAINMLTKGLALEVAADGIRVNAVVPGIIDTDLHASGGLPDRAEVMAPSVPMKRSGSAEEVAKAIAFLVSDASSYTTGTVLDVTGGR